jgi:hypothetical protein
MENKKGMMNEAPGALSPALKGTNLTLACSLKNSLRVLREEQADFWFTTPLSRMLRSDARLDQPQAVGWVAASTLEKYPRVFPT